MDQRGKGRSYPVQQTGPAPQAGQPAQYVYPQGPPPPYTQQQAFPQQYAPPPHPQYQQQQPPQYPVQQQFYQPPPQYQPQQQTVYCPGGFDAGARFAQGNATIPPPPPGCMPNAAQMAAANGQNVVVTQRPRDFVTGGSDGGYVIW